MAVVLATLVLASLSPASPFRERPLTAPFPKPLACVHVAPRGFEAVTSTTDRVGRCLAIFRSQAIDPTGEVTDGGYWLFVGAGDVWDDGTYLDLRMHQPYVIDDGAPFTLSDKGVLRIAAARQELDTQRIIFPPIVTPTRETKTPVVLESELTLLRRDSDRDGLTDWEELRLGLEPEVADTDGDGVADGRDYQPTIPANGKTTTFADALMLVIPRLLDERMDAIMALPARSRVENTLGLIGPGELHRDTPADVIFIVGDPAALAGFHHHRRIVVLDEARMQQVKARNGVTFAARVGWQLKNEGKQLDIDWDEGWRGVSAVLHWVDGAWVVKLVDGWVT